MAKRDGKILIIDDNEDLLTAFRIFLSRHFEVIHTLKNPNLILSEIEKHHYDIILLDMNFKAGQSTGNEGIFWLNKILEIDRNATVVFITAFGDIELATRSIKSGAADFIVKSWDEQKILSTILAAFKLRKSKLEVSLLKKKQDHLSREIGKDYPICYCQSVAMKKVFDSVEKIAGTDASVLIAGESGTGKEIIAREIHRLSARRKELFVKVDPSAIPGTLFESELFGHVRGAFTDAKEPRDGRFIIASGGTLFLDEIGNLPLDLQSKLLSVIQNREVFPLGSSHPVKIDVRLISATNMPLEEMIARKEFREDLYYRLNVIRLELPPLRKRREDIPLLSQFFLRKFREQYQKPGIKLGEKALKSLIQHEWPGNIRELQHTIEKSVILSDGNIILPEHLFSGDLKESRISVANILNLEENEKLIIEKALRHCGGNVTSAAKKLGINRSTLYDKMKRYGI